MNFGDYNPDPPQVKRRDLRRCVPQPGRHSPVGERHPPNRPCRSQARCLLWSRPQGVAGWRAAMVVAMVVAMEGPRTARKHNAGHILLAIGGAALFLQLWALWLEAGEAWSRAAAQSVGWMGALGMAALQMVDFIAWNPNGILLSLTRVLLLCWPVAVMIAGVVVSRGAN
jgi:hypothetical protein